MNKTFDGVLLAYDVNILDKRAKILSGAHPYFGLRLKANLLLFSPKPAMLLGTLSMIFQVIYLVFLIVDITLLVCIYESACLRYCLN